MADQTLGLDASGLIAALAEAEAAFKAHNATVNTTSNVYLTATETSKGIEVAFRSISAEGVKLQGVIRDVNGAFEAQVTSVTKVDDALKRLKATQLQAGATNAQAFLTQQNVSNAVPPDFLSPLRTAQQQLAKALAGDASGGLAIAQEIFAKLQQGVSDVEVGIRGKIQQALISVLNVQRQITAEQQKQANPSTPIGVSASQLQQLKSNIQGAFPVPTGANLASIITYQNALNGLIALAARGKVPFEELVRVFNAVAANPGRDVAGADIELQKVQAAAQRVVQSYNAMGTSAQAAGQQGQQAARSLFVSFDQFLKLIEIQVIHRIFGNLITGMQSSVGAAADLQIKISEIRTISQQSGISFEEFQQRIRALSEEFGRPQIDVARAAYQGFSNQVIKTAADMSVLNEALRLSRITVITAEEAINLLSSVLVSYGLNASEASRVTDQLFKAIEIGRFTGRDVADSLGRLTVTASQVGITTAEVLGLLARLTRAGVSPAEALTQINAIITSLSKPSTELAKRFQELGLDSGLSAIQTLGFVGTLRLLSEEATKSNSAISGLFNNVRAARGFRGAIAGGGTGGLEEDIRQVQDGRQQAENASRIISESAGDAFRKELIKVQNFFLNDFANSFLDAIKRIAEPFGGLSSVVKDFGRSVIDIASVLLQLAGAGLSVLSFFNSFGISIGSLVKIFIAYKALVIAQSIAHAVATTSTAVWNAAILSLTASQVANSAASATSTAATVANTGATGTAAITATGFGVIQVGNTAVIATYTTVTVAGRIATLALSAAMAAIPIIAIVAGLAFLLGAFDTTTSKLKRTEVALEALGSIQNNLHRDNEAQQREQDRRDQAATTVFNNQVEERSRTVNAALTVLSQGANAAVEVQREIVRETTELLKQAADSVRNEMSQIISDLRRDIAQATTSIRQSVKRETEFADREAKGLFERRLREAGRQPEIVRNLRPLSFEDRQFQSIERTGQATSFQQQRLLIQQRIVELTQQAEEATARGDQVSIESARRKFEEIRRLTEQLFGLETERGRQQALDAATDAARASGTLVQASFTVNLDRLRAQLDAITAQEKAAEASFRESQSRQRAENQAVLQERLVQQRALQRALQELTSFSTTNDQGALRPEFQGAGGAERARQEFQARADRARAAAEAAGISSDATVALETAIGNQRRALVQQVERQITQDTINELRRRFQLARDELSRAQQEAQGAAREARATISESVERLPTLLQTILQNVQNNNVSALEIARARAAANLAASNPFGSGADPALDATANNLERARRAQTTLLRQQGEAATALTTFNDARQRALQNPSDPAAIQAEADALAVLRTKIAQVTDTYREFLRLRFGDTQIPGGTRTGNQEAEFSNALNQQVENIRTATQRIADSSTRIAAAQAQVTTLTEQLRLVNPELLNAAQNLNIAGEAAQAQTLNFNTLAQALNSMAAAVERLNRAGPIPVPRAVGAPAAPTVPEEGFAGGGMIGNAFSKNGPDDTLIWAKKGEFVVKPESTRKFYSQLVALNSGRMPRHYAEGGVVTTTNVGDVTIHVDGSKSPESTARAVLAHMKREFRKGNG